MKSHWLKLVITGCFYEFSSRIQNQALAVSLHEVLFYRLFSHSRTRPFLGVSRRHQEARMEEHSPACSLAHGFKSCALYACLQAIQHVAEQNLGISEVADF